MNLQFLFNLLIAVKKCGTLSAVMGRANHIDPAIEACYNFLQQLVNQPSGQGEIPDRR